MKSINGFSLIEIIIVITALIIIAALTIPVGVNFYKKELLNETSQDVLNIVRSAREKAIFQKNDSNFGVKFFSGSYVSFRGDSYDSRIPGEDEDYYLPIGISIIGLDQIVFAKLTGNPSVAGIITISFGSEEHKILINEQGLAEIQ